MNYLRLYKILSVLKAYQLSELLPKHALSTKLKFVLAILFWIRKKHPNKKIGERLQLALQELGPVWIKLGQMLSTRYDLLPNDIINELSKLQDNVEAFDGDEAKQIIEQALAAPIDSYFSNFNPIPLASASIAQVHSATLNSSQASIVIKVLRPNIEKKIQSDIKVMYWIAKKITKWFAFGEKLRAIEVVQDYEKTILDELDLRKEAENTLQLHQNFLDSDMLYIPYVYRELCRKNILVEERITGIPIANIDEIKAQHVNVKLLAERGVIVFFTQVFRDNFFHADMHPGNIFVDAQNPINPRYIGIDCAIVGKLSKADQHFLAQNFIAFFNRDYKKIAELYIESNWVAENTNIFDLESAMRQVCEPIFAKPLGEISFAHILLNLFNVAKEFDMEIQPQLILLQKTLFYIEGLGRRLYPQLDLWATAKPFLESWYHEQTDIKNIAKKCIAAFPIWQEFLPSLPTKIKQYDKENKQLKKEISLLNQSIKYSERRQKKLFIITILTFLTCFSFYFFK